MYTYENILVLFLFKYLSYIPTPVHCHVVCIYFISNRIYITCVNLLLVCKCNNSLYISMLCNYDMSMNSTLIFSIKIHDVLGIR